MSSAQAAPAWRRWFVTLLKIGLGALILWFIASKLTIDDVVGLASETDPSGIVADGDREELRGRSLKWEGRITLLDAAGSTVVEVDLVEDTPVILRQEDRWRIKDRDDKVHDGVRLLKAGSVSLEISDESGTTTKTLPLSDVAWHKLGDSDGWKVVELDVKQGLASIFSRIRLVDWLLAMASILGMYLCGIKRWQILLRAQGIVVSFFEALRLTFIGFFFNNVVPGMTGGDLVKAVMIARNNPGRGPDAVSTVIVDRMIGLLVLAAIAAVVLLFSYSEYSTIALWVFLMLGGAALAITLFLSRRVRTLLGIDRLLKRLPGSDALRRLDQAFLLYRSRKQEMTWAILLSILAHGFNILSVLILGLAIGVAPENGLKEPVIVTYLVVVPIIMIVSAVPLLPGGWGVGEAAFGGFFRTVGIGNLSLSVGLSVLHRSSMLLWSLVGGVFLLLHRAEAREAIAEAHELEDATANESASLE